MKAAFFILAVLCVGHGAVAGPLETRNLNDDFQDFAKLIPSDQIADIVLSNLGDPDVQMIIEYIFSEKFSSLVQEIERLPEYKPIVEYLTVNGLPVKEWIAALHDFLGIPPPPTRSSQRSLRDIVDQIKAIIPFDALMKLYNDKLSSSASFKDLDKQIRDNPTVRGFAKGIAANSKVVDIYNVLIAKGLKIDEVIARVKAFYGWN